jgi:hypothetical protein
MLKTVMPFFVIGACLAAACSGSSPSGDCQNYTNVFCNKYFQCAQTAAIAAYGNESACVTKTQNTLNCAAWACGTGQTYDGSQVEACINAINNESCADATNTPTECMGLAPACH